MERPIPSLPGTFIQGQHKPVADIVVESAKTSPLPAPVDEAPKLPAAIAKSSTARENSIADAFTNAKAKQQQREKEQLAAAQKKTTKRRKKQ